MAVKKSEKTIKDFRRYHRKLSFWLVIVSQFIATGGLGVLIYLAGIIDPYDPMVWAALSGAFLIGTSVLFAFARSITDPLYDILAAMMHKTGEPTTTTPPNINAKRNKETGFRSVLKVIYDSKMKQDIQTSSIAHTEEDELPPNLSQALSHTNCGVVIYGKNKDIISANRAAPIAHKQDGTPFLALNFINEQDILEWIKEAEEEEIKSEKRWQRVGTDPRYLTKQKFYDIVASYEKGAKAETVVFLIEQTRRYMPEEEDLNFIAFAAHELRGPITVIRGYLDVLEREMSDRLKGDEPELFDRLTVSANRLSSYVNNILNVAKLDRHHLKVYLHEETVHDIYDSIAYDMKLRAQSQKRLLTVDIPKDLPTVAADRNSIGEVIGNLIDNAIKYSFEGGSVVVKAEAKGDFVEISVKDNGIGMPPSVIKNLFRKFYRSHRSRDSVAGSGIGLYICRAYINSHGGNMSVRSVENNGSTFTFTLPIYATVADKLLEDGQLNKSLVRHKRGWIKNHAMYRE